VVIKGRIEGYKEEMKGGVMILTQTIEQLGRHIVLFCALCIDGLIVEKMWMSRKKTDKNLNSSSKN
jgi:hypothetical protein